MWIYGTHNRIISTENLYAFKCPNCTKPDGLFMSVNQVYAHLFWIPFFPLNKTRICYSKHFATDWIKEKQMPDILGDAGNDLKKRTSTPIFTFSGIFMLALLGIFLGTKHCYLLQ